MGVVAFDAKLFQRSRVDRTSSAGSKVQCGFHTHLGVGVEIPDERAFAEAYFKKSAELASSFGIPFNRTVFSSRQLMEALDISQVRAFAEKLIMAVQDHISRIHCAYAILSPNDIPSVKIGGHNCPIKTIPTIQFLDKLGPMFSYLTANSYLTSHKNPNKYELHIDAFRSNPTKAWSMVAKNNPKIYCGGDECNPFISAAGIIAFLTDVKLYSSWMRITGKNIQTCWKNSPFETTVEVFNKNNLDCYKWQSNVEIDTNPYLYLCSLKTSHIRAK